MTATLKRKLAGEHRESSARQMTALRALRLSVARAGEDLFELALGMVGGKQARLLPDDLDGVLSDDDMLMVLDCPGGMTGAASVSLPLVGALIQQQTMGRVLDRPADPRPYTDTDTDAALAAPLLEGVLSRACDLAEDEGDQACFRSIRFGARIDDARTVLLALRARRYRIFTLTVDIALGTHQAQVVLVLPDHGDARNQDSPDSASAAERAAQSPLLEVETELRAVLARFRLPVSELNALKVGDTLPLPRERLDDTALVTLTDRVVARGQLGQMNGHRAVRLMAQLPVPRLASSDRFDPQLTALAPASESAEAFAAPDMPDMPDLSPDLSMDDLSTLSPEEAADQITALAGLTPDDLAAFDGGAEGTDDNIQLPATFPAADLDLDLGDIDLNDL
ncbi:FliM/FliN family flagellar motor C-terminal domain-containing protein [Aestuariivita boseongensis]|uniref:FliM/FliN family flagellar motor C-terminal domain-containing protein n=1 Tax=Aestuariivita boseongensis TaxID=1470562 RepID=UPI000680CB7C|nr:FliM/FliN family flagellar motor C-terminal domain-containing protein [Aestuariivita boseongensis]